MSEVLEKEVEVEQDLAKVEKDARAEAKRLSRIAKQELAEKHKKMIMAEREKNAEQKRLDDAAKKIERDKVRAANKIAAAEAKKESRRLRKIQKEEDRAAKEAIPISPFIAKLRAFIKSARDYLIIGFSLQVLVVILWMVFGDAAKVMGEFVLILKINLFIALLYGETLFIEWYLSKIHGGK